MKALESAQLSTPAIWLTSPSVSASIWRAIAKRLSSTSSLKLVPDVTWRPMRQPDLETSPIEAAQFTHDVLERGNRGIPDLAGRLCIRLVDLVLEHRRPAVDVEGRRCAADVKMQVADKAVQRAAPRLARLGGPSRPFPQCEQALET